MESGIFLVILDHLAVPNQKFEWALEILFFIIFYVVWAIKVHQHTLKKLLKIQKLISVPCIIVAQH